MIEAKVVFNEDAMIINGIEINIESGCQFPYFEVNGVEFTWLEQAVIYCLEQSNDNTKHET